MSGILAVVDPHQRFNTNDSVGRMLSALTSRGSLSEIWRSGDSVLAVARFDWEMADGFSGPALVVNDGSVSVVADATLYYAEDLLRALAAAGVRPTGPTASHLIAAAYRAWGEDCADHLEGDFAFVVCDRARQRTFAARDFMGRRPLYYAHVDGMLVIASTLSAIVAHPDAPNEFDVAALAEIIGVSLAGPARTPYKGVSLLPPATALVRDANGTTRTKAYWSLQLEERHDRESFDAAAERVRALLSAAVTERCTPSGPTAIWLSGGYDSPAMYGVGNAALDRLGRNRLLPISFSHPVGDPGREDELIEDVTRFWNARPVWLHIDDVPLLRDAAANAARADAPLQHAFENWLRALFAATRDQQSHVALNGDGGDQLFAVSAIFLRDLFSSFRWRELRREWRAFGGAGARELWRTVARPELEDRLSEHRGIYRPSMRLPEWIQPDLTRQHGLDVHHADAEAALAAPGGGRAGTETRRAFANPTTPRLFAALSSMGLDYSVELRSPLFDRRIVEYAFQRPRTERASRGAVKHLLRHAARDLLPPAILAPRAVRTGTLTSYFVKSFRADPDGIVSDAFDRSRLADLGVVDAASLQQAWRRYKTKGEGSGGHLVVAFQTELWVRSHGSRAGGMTESPAQLLRMPAAGFLQ